MCSALCTAHPGPSTRRWARVGIAAQVIFVASWLAAASWQGPRYRVLAHSISEMYARTAPHPTFLLIVFTLCGAATILFALRSVWPALAGFFLAHAMRRAPGRRAWAWPARWTAVLFLALGAASVLEVLGDHPGAGSALG